MAPEQAQLAAVDHRADIFALGCVLFEMLHGAPPCRGENELDTLQRVREGRIRVPPGQQAVPAALHRVLDRALAADREARYRCAAEMAADLRAYLAEVGSPSPENLGRWVRELEATPESAPESRVDDAVRRLLGGGDGEDSQPSSTAMFASSSSEESRRESSKSTAGSGRRLQLAVFALVVIGLVGWLLWALGPSQSTRGADIRGQRVDAGPASLAAPVLDRGRRSARRDAVVVQRPTLQLRSQPAGAAVYVNAEPKGHTPLRLEIPQAPFWLELQREGYRPWQRRIDPASVEESLVASLVPVGPAPLQSTITINTLPWSRVRIDGKLVGNTPLVRLAVRTGNHRLELLAPDGVVRRSLSFRLAAGENRSFTFDFSQ